MCKIKFVILLDSEANRLYTRYYFEDGEELSTFNSQIEFEKQLMKTAAALKVKDNGDSSFLSS